MDAMTPTFAHFSLSDQFTGFLGSSGPSQSTMFGFNTSAMVVSSSFLSESSLRWPASRSISFSRLELAGDPFSFATGSVEVNGAASGTDTGIASDFSAPDAVFGLKSGFVVEAAFVALQVDGTTHSVLATDVSSSDADQGTPTIMLATDVSSSDPVVRAFSAPVKFASVSATFPVPAVII